MEQFVLDFEKFLKEEADKKERELYSDIKHTLERKIHRNVDLEAIFTVIDGIINFDDPEKLGMLALYFETARKNQFPNTEHRETCEKLKTKFQNFIKEKCDIPKTFAKIKKVYRDFFNRIAIELGQYDIREKYAYNESWKLFTTNYDTCLEYFWREVVQIDLDTNFQYDRIRKRDVLRPNSILAEPPSGVLKLFKLHGSFNWLIDEKTGDVIEVTEKGSSVMGRSYSGEMMLYPIAEKELYLEPYVSMLARLNRELKRKMIWIVIGYSFNDPVIQGIFHKNWSSSKRLILVHPHATEIINRKLSGINVDPLEKYFGLTDVSEFSGKKVDYRHVNHQIIHKLKETPKFGWNQDPL